MYNHLNISSWLSLLSLSVNH